MYDHKKNIIAWVVVLLIAGAGTWAVEKYYFEEENLSGLDPNNNNNLTENSSIEGFKKNGDVASTSEIDISTWKTYRNEEYGFEVKYPSNFNFELDDIKKLSLGQNLSVKIIDQSLKYPPYFGMYFGLEIWKEEGNHNYYNPEQIPEISNPEDEYEQVYSAFELRTLNGIKGLEVYDDFCNELYGCDDRFIFERGGLKWFLYLNQAIEGRLKEDLMFPAFKLNEAVYQQILSTFKFIN
jgi:hypothetical protein